MNIKYLRFKLYPTNSLNTTFSQNAVRRKSLLISRKSSTTAAAQVAMKLYILLFHTCLLLHICYTYYFVLHSMDIYSTTTQHFLFYIQYILLLYAFALYTLQSFRFSLFFIVYYCTTTYKICMNCSTNQTEPLQTRCYTTIYCIQYIYIYIYMTKCTQTHIIRCVIMYDYWLYEWL